MFVGSIIFILFVLGCVLIVGCTEIEVQKEGGALFVAIGTGLIALALGTLLLVSFAMGRGRPKLAADLTDQAIYEVGPVIEINGQAAAALRAHDEKKFFLYAVNDQQMPRSGFVKAFENSDGKGFTFMSFPPHTTTAPSNQ